LYLVNTPLTLRSGSLAPFQSSRLFFGAGRWNDGTGSVETLGFVSRKLEDVLHGRNVERSAPPPIDILCSHAAEVRIQIYVADLS
jgi:hypothetical protein